MVVPQYEHEGLVLLKFSSELQQTWFELQTEPEVWSKFSHRPNWNLRSGLWFSQLGILQTVREHVWVRLNSYIVCVFQPIFGCPPLKFNYISVLHTQNWVWDIQLLCHVTPQMCLRLNSTNTAGTSTWPASLGKRGGWQETQLGWCIHPSCKSKSFFNHVYSFFLWVVDGTRGCHQVIKTPHTTITAHYHYQGHSHVNSSQMITLVPTV